MFVCLKLCKVFLLTLFSIGESADLQVYLYLNYYYLEVCQSGDSECVCVCVLVSEVETY